MGFELFGETSVVQIAAILFLISITVALIRQRYFSPVSDIPGPFFASFGTCWQLWHVFKGRIDEATYDLHLQHGPFVRLSYNEVSINHPDAVSAVLAAPIPKAPFYVPFAIPNINYNNLMSECDPKRHVAMRANVASGYTLSNVLRNETYIDRTIALMEERLEQTAGTNEPVEFSKWIHFVTWDILGEVTFSERFGFLDQARDVGNAIENTFALALYITTAGYIQWLHALLLGNPILRWLDFQPNEHTYQTCVASLNKRKANPEARVDMVEQWMSTLAKHPDRMKEKDILCAAAANLGAGGDTVAITLQAFFYLLLKNPLYLDRLRQEIDGSQARGELSKIVTYSEAQKLPYLQACVKETLRIFPAIPWNLPRVVPKEGLTIAGHHFKAGTILSVNPWIIHRNQSLFGKDACIYNPERWLDPEHSKAIEKYLIPFGLGYNSCPGRNVASLELNKITATLIRDFELRLAEPDREWRYHTLFISIQSGWPCYIKRRAVGGEKEGWGGKEAVG
ncbi:hypothetical protein MMC30_009170 [Trapelia coarctata]|nr:hypothetical protein [Trapelia coarctata]